VLILTRKAGESIVIGNNVRVTVVELTSGIVRLGFEAPAEVSIYREEIYREIVEANRRALGETERDDDSAG
jgi:carbon storage regulator